MSEENKTKKVKKILGIKGMNDILPEDAPVWELLENTVESVLKSSRLRENPYPDCGRNRSFCHEAWVLLPISSRKKCILSRDSLNGDQLTLRPESTAGVVRAVVEHNLTYNGPKRLWYSGPMFRHERPQRGRYRQFHQIGAEAVGFPGPDIDAELILLCQRLWDDLGLENIRLEINSIGNAEERNRHRADLIAYFEQHKGLLDEDAHRRLYSNPLRILDTKNPAMQDMVNAAPKLLDYLEKESLAHFEGVQRILKRNNIPYTINPRLVRGMDYYNRTVFEWISEELGSQGTVCGGGRYDPLFEMFGGKPTPSCGFALGMERLIELLKTQGEVNTTSKADVFIAHQGEDALPEAFVLAESLRNTGLDVIVYCTAANSGGSSRRRETRGESGALLAVLIGEDEVKNGEASVKALRSDNTADKQLSVPFEKVADYLVDQIVGECGCEDDHHSSHDCCSH